MKVAERGERERTEKEAPRCARAVVSIRLHKKSRVRASEAVAGNAGQKAAENIPLEVRATKSNHLQAMFITRFPLRGLLLCDPRIEQVARERERMEETRMAKDRCLFPLSLFLFPSLQTPRLAAQFLLSREQCQRYGGGDGGEIKRRPRRLPLPLRSGGELCK